MGGAVPDLLMHVTKLLKNTVIKKDLETNVEEKALVLSTRFKIRGCIIPKQERLTAPVV